MIGDIPIVTKVRPAGSRTLHVRFAGDRRAYVVALTGLIARSKHFAPLMEDADTFAKLDILDDGIGVAWPIDPKLGRLGLSSSTPRGIAEEQLPMRGADFSKWRKSLGLSLTEAAKLLGVSRRTIMAYLKKNELPPVVAIACRALARDKHLLARTTCRHELFIISPEPANHSISDRIPVSGVTRARPS
jgi:DNA-binding XRE family transcriptional regulator